MFKNSEIKTFNKNLKLEIRNSGYYLIVSRLFPHKNIEIAVEAFAKLKLPLVIIGTGPEKNRLMRYCATELKAKNIHFLGFVPDSRLSSYYQNCRAFIMPQEEDFGITPIEAMSYGKPVLALRKGGAVETIVEGETGEFFDDLIPEALADGVRRLNENYKNFDSNKINLWSQKFSKEKFRREFRYLLKESFQSH
jgi:glycosyltransferase involved in cell wall biosynthesis